MFKWRNAVTNFHKVWLRIPIYQIHADIIHTCTFPPLFTFATLYYSVTEARPICDRSVTDPSTDLL